MVYIHIIYSYLVPYEQTSILRVSGARACLRYINHTKSCPTYWHHIHPLTSPFFYHLHLETSHRPFHIITRLTPNIETTSVSYEIHGPTPRPTRSRSPARADEIPGALRQSDALLLARMSDVIHHPMRYHDNTSSHEILTSNIIIRRNL